MAVTAEAVEEKTDQTQAQSIELSEAVSSEGGISGGSIDILLDMKIPVTVAVGQKEMTVRELLGFGPGSVMKLDKPIDAPADLYLRGTKFATGTIVVVDSRFAVKIKEISGLTTGSKTKTEQ
jgi:flagellar motor switch protein FliN/FliY